METVNIGTTQNVTISYQLAGLMERIVAFLIDIAVLLAYVLIFFLVMGTIFNDIPTAVAIVGSLLANQYFLLTEIFMDGQTIGKRAQNLKVAKLDGSKPGVGAYLLRWIMIPIDFSLGGGIAIVMIIFTRNAQRLGDLLAGTTVVKLRKKDFTLKRSRQLLNQIDENYQPVFADAIKMNDSDVRLIRHAIHAFRENGNRKPVELLKTKMEEKLQVKSDLPPIKFLHTLTKDYNHFAAR